MNIDIADEGFGAIAEYARVPIAFEVRAVLDVVARDGGLGGLLLAERSVDAPYLKNYDALDGGPAGWAARFDVSSWGLLVARSGRRVIGGAAIAFDTAGVEMLEGRRDLAVLWDLRVAPEARGRGAGSALFRAAEAWAAARGCRRMKIETQNVNVPACRFYAARGCVLGAIHRFAYPGLPHEAQLLWYRELAPAE
ncbi:MAG TPA: GNAT family N-acetyltransferase [Longimicrobium sp.]|nr:GNAT family N-acetyltransferase [Longimicrobium sp.]